MPPLGKAPALISEHGVGQIVVKQHTRKAPTKKTPPPVSKSPGKTPPVATGTSKPVVNPVDAQVTAAQLPANQQIDAAATASAQAAKNQATTTEGYYQALASLLQGIGPATQAGYAQAGAADSAFGKGFSDGLAHVQSQNQDAATNAAGISGGLAPPPTTPAASDALYTMGGYIPATTMEREGAAFGAAANQLPATAAGQGAATIEGIGAQQKLDAAGFDKQRADLAAQVPGLRAQYQSQYDAQQNALANQKIAITNAANHEADVKRQQQISMILATGVGPDGKLTPKAQAQLASALGYDPITGKPTAKTVVAQTNAQTAQVNAQTAQGRLTVAQATALSNMYGVDASGKLTLPGRRAALAEWKAQHAGTKGGFTKAQLQKIASKAGQTASDYFNGKTKVVMVAGSPQTVTVANPVADYQTALKDMVSAGVPLTIAQNALNAYWPMGNANKGKTDHGGPLPYGRPYLTLQQRSALAQLWPGHNVDPFAVPTQEEVGLLAKTSNPYKGPVTTGGAVPYPPPPK